MCFCIQLSYSQVALRNLSFTRMRDRSKKLTFSVPPRTRLCERLESPSLECVSFWTHSQTVTSSSDGGPKSNSSVSPAVKLELFSKKKLKANSPTLTSGKFSAFKMPLRRYASVLETSGEVIEASEC